MKLDGSVSAVVVGGASGMLGRREEYASLAMEIIRNSYFNAALLRLDAGARV